MVSTIPTKVIIRSFLLAKISDNHVKVFIARTTSYKNFALFSEIFSAQFSTPLITLVGIR